MRVLGVPQRIQVSRTGKSAGAVCLPLILSNHINTHKRLAPLRDCPLLSISSEPK